MPFKSAEERRVGAWKPRPTAEASAAIRRNWDERIKAEAVFGARITSRAYCDAIKRVLAEVVGGTLTPQDAERRLRETLRGLGYSPQAGFPGRDGGVPPASPMSIRDLSSSRRIQLIIDTNVKRARSMGQVASSEDPVMLMATPAWELTRTGARKKPRGDWRRRWAAAGAKCGWAGAAKQKMVALKTSPIWQALADGAGGFDDTLGSPFPPFAFGSGLAWVGVGRKEWKRICAAEGIDDGLGDVDAKAAELDAERRGAKSQKVEIQMDVPTMGGKPQGVENPLTKPQGGEAGRPEAAGTGYRAQTGAAFATDYTGRNRANDAVDEALDAIGAFGDETAAWQMEAADALKVAKAAADADTGEGEARIARLESRLAAIERRQADIAGFKGRVVNYGGAIATVPKPRDAREQGEYDDTMKRYALAAGRAVRKAQSARDAAALEVMAARRDAPGAAE